VPAGWQVYSGPHFTIAYLAGGSVTSSVQANSTAQRPNVVYGITAQGKYAVTVNEQDNWDDATIQNDFCRNPTNDPTVTLAGLPMRYSTGAGGAGRSWLFITDKGTVYGLGTDDGYAGKDVQAQDNAILATFRAEYTTPGCAK